MRPGLRDELLPLLRLQRRRCLRVPGPVGGEARRGHRGPAAEENPVAAVENSFRQLTAAYNDRSALVRVVRATPSLREAERINREHLRMAVVNALATRLGFDPENDMRPQILATIAFAALDAAMFARFGGAQTMSSGICSTRRRRPSNESETRCARV